MRIFSIKPLKLALYCMKVIRVIRERYWGRLSVRTAHPTNFSCAGALGGRGDHGCGQSPRAVHLVHLPEGGDCRRGPGKRRAPGPHRQLLGKDQAGEVISVAF